jgi:RNA polymerase sigma-70 factor (ECF subfamily)
MNLYQQQDAMDVTQEVFLRAYRGLKTFRYRSAPFTWLYRTMKNVCQEYNRKTKRDGIASSEYVTELDNITDNSDVEAIHYLSEIRQLLKSLPKRQHEVVLLRIFEGFSINETASIMKCRPGTVKALLHKAQKQINILENISYD